VIVSAKQPTDCMTFCDVMRLFRADLIRRFELKERRMTPLSLLQAFLSPGVLGVLLFRVGNWLHAKDYRIAFRLIERFIFLITRAELQTGARIGPGLVLPDEGTVGISSHSRLGLNCTLFALSTIVAKEGGADDIVIGDYCVIGRRARLYGAIELGDGTQVKDNSMVFSSVVHPGMILCGVPAHCTLQVPLELVRNWNPLKGKPLRAASTPRTL